MKKKVEVELSNSLNQDVDHQIKELKAQPANYYVLNSSSLICKQINSPLMHKFLQLQTQKKYDTTLPYTSKLLNQNPTNKSA